MSTKASGLHSQLSKSATLLGLQVAVTVLGPLEILNRRLQSKTETVAGMMECVQVVADELSLLRCDNKFEEVLERCNLDASRLGLEPLTVPRIRKPPARFTGTGRHIRLSLSGITISHSF